MAIREIIEVPDPRLKQVSKPVETFDQALHPDAEPEKEPRVFINPVLTPRSEELSVYSEGCLSVPEIYADVTRPAAIHARWQDLDGTVHEADIDDLLATCLQHEMDHLEGILFIDHLSRLKRGMVLKKLEKIRRAA
eukprot:gene5682-5743_t